MKPSGDFSLRALYDALDAQRRERGLTWAGVTRDMHQAPERPSRRRLSASTLTRTRIGRAAEGDGVLAMLRWLNRTAESFMPGYHESEGISARLPDVPSGKVWRFDTKKLYAALDARRLERKMEWAQVAEQIGFPVASLTGIPKRTRVAFPGVMRIFRWLDRPAADFTRASDI